MELKRFEKDVEIIQKLGTYPNRDNGLTSEDLKKKFDEAPTLIKEYLNEELVPAFEDMASTVGGGDFLRYREQDLTPEQQEQARKNIDALKVPRGYNRELFFFGEYDDFQTYGNQRIYKIAGQQVWMNSPTDFDFRVRFNTTRNIGQVEEYEFTKSDCTIIETVQGRKHWQFFANVSGTPSLVLTVANGIDPVSFESEPYCSFIYPSDLENYSVEFFKLSETEQELNLVTSVNGIQADEYGNVDVKGNDGFSPVAKVTQTDTGAVISITDKKGTTTATVTNGKDGAKGDKGDKGDTGAKGDKGDTGEKGEDGVSPNDVYVLSENETVENAPEDVKFIVDPYGEVPTYVQTVNGIAPDKNGNVVVSGGGSGGGESSPLKYKRLNLDFAASDLTPRYAQTESEENYLWGFSFSDTKREEVAELMEELSALNTVYMCISLSVSGIGEVMRTAANFKVKNSATGSNGQICVASYRGMILKDGELEVEHDIVSIYTNGMDIFPHDYADVVAMLGVSIAIDVIYL